MLCGVIGFPHWVGCEGDGVVVLRLESAVVRAGQNTRLPPQLLFAQLPPLLSHPLTSLSSWARGRKEALAAGKRLEISTLCTKLVSREIAVLEPVWQFFRESKSYMPAYLHAYPSTLEAQTLPARTRCASRVEGGANGSQVISRSSAEGQKEKAQRGSGMWTVGGGGKRRPVCVLIPIQDSPADGTLASPC